MFWGQKAVVIGISCLTAGCTMLPKPVERDGVNVSLVVDRIQCELASVFAHKHVANVFDNWAAGTLLQLRVTEQITNLGASLSIAEPLSSTTLTIPVGVTLNWNSMLR
jgi:hypothetical protein